MVIFSDLTLSFAFPHEILDFIYYFGTFYVFI